jgi:hypothetical protein
MVKRIDKSIGGEVDKLNQQDAAAVLTHLRDALSSGRSHSNDNPLNDELIVSLADAYENRRAQQVSEWERRQHVAKVF